MGKPGLGNQGNHEVCEIGEQLSNAIFDVVQKAISIAIKNCGANIGDAAYMSCLSAMTAAKISCFSFAKKPQVTAEEAEKRGDELMYTLITPEALQFSCLAASLMLVEYNAKTGENTVEFGAPIFWEALQLWQKLNPEKDPDKYLDKVMLKAARLVGNNSTIPFDEFIMKRTKAHPSPSTLQ